MLPHFETAARVNLFAQAELLEAGKGRFDDIGGVFGSERLAQYVPDPDRLQDSSHCLPRDDAGARRSRAQQDESPAITSLDFMGDGLFFQGDGDHLALGHFASLANRIGNLSSFAETDANTPLLVADYNEGAEAKAASAFDHF